MVRPTTTTKTVAAAAPKKVAATKAVAVAAPKKAVVAAAPKKAVVAAAPKKAAVAKKAVAAAAPKKTSKKQQVEEEENDLEELNDDEIAALEKEFGLDREDDDVPDNEFDDEIPEVDDDEEEEGEQTGEVGYFIEDDVVDAWDSDNEDDDEEDDDEEGDQENAADSFAEVSEMVPLKKRKAQQLETVEPKKSKLQLKEERALAKAERQEKSFIPNDPDKIIYIGHLPHGFYETQLTAYFKQFGNVLGVKVARNPKTKESKHYAFVKFDDADVAKVAADTMNGYIMFKRRLVCKVTSTAPANEFKHKKAAESRPGDMPSLKNLSAFNEKKLTRKARAISESNKNPKKTTERLLSKESAKRQKLKQMNIQYDFPGFSSQIKK
eukprot:gene8994-10549_t